MGTTSSRGKPLLGSKRGSRARPLSITTRTPGRVTEDSATLVASTTRRRPSGAGCSTRDCCSTGSSPCRASTSVSAGSAAASSAACTRAISRWPGRNTSTSPGCRASASSAARRAWACSDSSRRAGKWLTATGWPRPSLDSRGASRNAARRCPSRVADITTIRRSSRRPACTSRASARPRSAARWRSWNSSNSRAPMPSSSGSSWIIRVRMPSVTTSIRVRADTLFSKRIR